MQNLQFESEEQDVLREVLQHLLQEINVEVFRTDTHDFKEMLKHRRHVLEQILAKLPGEPVTAQ